MKRSRFSTFLRISALAGLMAGTPALAETLYVTIATSSMGSPLYAAGNVLAQEINKAIPDAKASARVTAGSIQNLDLLARKSVEIALGDSVSPKDALDGEGVFEGKKDPLVRGITCIWPSVIQIVVPQSINTVADLRGKKVAIGARGSAATRYAEVALAAADMILADIKPEHVSYEEGKGFLQDGHVSGSLHIAVPNALVTELMSTGKFKILEFSEAELKKMNAKYPPFKPFTIKPNTYQNQPNPVSVYQVPNIIFTRENVDSELVYQVTKIIYENQKELAAGYKLWGFFKLENALKGMPIPLHPGAARYFKEKGLNVGGQ
jgi:TRAP transporter TAXI family solute receptor